MTFYRFLLRCFPPAFRERFGDDMAGVFADRLREARARGALATARFYVRTTADALQHGFAERRRARSTPRGDSMIATMWQDIRYGWRFFTRRPGFAALAVLTLALGIGANTAIFSVVKAVIFAPLPYRDPGSLAIVWNATGRDGRTWLSLREIAGYREAKTFDRISGYTNGDFDLTGGDEPERVRGAAVTAEFFETLGVAPVAGRSFVAADGQPGAPLVVMLGEGLWRRRFGGANDVIGRTIVVNGRAREVVGVIPTSLRLPVDYRTSRPTEAFVPVTIDPANPGSWGDRSYYGIGRLRAGVTPGAASSELYAIGDRWIQAGYMQDQGDGRMHRNAILLPEFVTGELRGPMLTLLGAVGFVLLIACANVINLLLAKAEVRRREVVVRTALGAQRAQIVRQMLTESALLAGAGGLAGLALAKGGLTLLLAARPALVPRVDDASIDPGVLAFTAGLSVLAALVFGLIPALQLSRQHPGEVLKDSGRTVGQSRARTAVRRTLVVVQIACTVVLLVGAGLLMRTLVALNRVDLGFNPANILTAQLQISSATYKQPADVVGFYRSLLEKLQALPGVTAAGAIRLLPLSQTIGNWSITVEGAMRAPGDNPNGDFQWVTAGYFKAMGTPLKRGRFIEETDREDAALVAVVNETMAQKYWPGQDALGKRFHMGTADQPWMTIVGVLGGTHHNAFNEPPRAEMYLPHAQLPQTIGGAPRAMALVLKTSVDPLTLAAPLRATVRDMDRNLPVSEIRTLERIAADSLSDTRFAALLLGLFAVLALVLAAVGVYGTISLLVTERAPEIGIRLALGATRGSVLGLVLGQGLALAATGIAVGIAAAIALTRLLATIVYGVGTLDLLTFAIVPLVLAGIALLACLAPAQRAARLDPIVTLKSGSS